MKHSKSCLEPFSAIGSEMASFNRFNLLADASDSDSDFGSDSGA